MGYVHSVGALVPLGDVVADVGVQWSGWRLALEGEVPWVHDTLHASDARGTHTTTTPALRVALTLGFAWETP